MTVSINNSMGSALTHAQYGMHQASQKVTEAASQIARQNNEPSAQGLVTHLMALQTNTIYHEAAAKVVSVTDDTVGQLIDTRA
ncbi:hypothetical protein [Salinimonas chungwhensis]|uniref:hypothetical protein n=1 Tax=Salinimonas chungwhensis TaxID=265425 RepID=UPI0003709C87|nr:hypothetical protein [Salinimonas chungwhensis]